MPITIGKKAESDYSNPLGLLSDCHRRVEQFLGVLIEVTRQARGANLNEDQRSGLEAAIRYFREAAPKHTRDEEESLFPRILASTDERALAAISLLDELNEEHRQADAAHSEVERLAGQWLSNGVLSSESTDRLSGLLDQLQSTYEKHIAVEEHEVFPLASSILSSLDLAAVGREMAARRSLKPSTPESSLCGSPGADKQ